MNKTVSFWLQIIFLLFLPIGLMAASPAFMSIRAYVMGIAGLYLLYVILKNKYSLTDLGLTFNNIKESGSHLFVPSIAMVITSALIMFYTPEALRNSLIGTDPQQISSFPLRIFLYSFWSVPFQEFLFRGYLYQFARTAYSSPRVIAVIMWLVFVLAHLPFFSPMMMIIAGWMGYVYVNNYLKYHNLIPIMCSHAVVGSLLIILRNFYLPYN